VIFFGQFQVAGPAKDQASGSSFAFATSRPPPQTASPAALGRPYSALDSARTTADPRRGFQAQFLAKLGGFLIADGRFAVWHGLKRRAQFSSQI